MRAVTSTSTLNVYAHKETPLSHIRYVAKITLRGIGIWSMFPRAYNSASLMTFKEYMKLQLKTQALATCQWWQRRRRHPGLRRGVGRLRNPLTPAALDPLHGS